jgi:hypothetical protein
MRAPGAWVLAWLALLPAGDAFAAESRFPYEELRIEIPEKFGERVSGPPSLPDSKIADVAFVAKKSSGPQHYLELRAAVIPGFPSGSDSTAEQEGDLYFVAQIVDKQLNELKARSTGFGRTDATRVKLGGHLALRATWVGLLLGEQFNGVVYCMLIGGKIFELSAMGPGARPDETLKLALNAIDRLTIAGKH